MRAITLNEIKQVSGSNGDELLLGAGLIAATSFAAGVSFCKLGAATTLGLGAAVISVSVLAGFVFFPPVHIHP